MRFLVYFFERNYVLVVPGTVLNRGVKESEVIDANSYLNVRLARTVAATSSYKYY